MIRIDEQRLTPGKAVARSYIKQRGISDPAAQASIERFLSVYEAVREEVGSHDAAVYVASGEARGVLRAKPRAGDYRYPQEPGSLLARIECQPATLAGYFSYLHETAEHIVGRGEAPPAIAVANRTYVLHKPIAEEPLVGLEQEQQDLAGYARQLFLYDPQTMSNPDTGRFPRTVLLAGPPGTGKSSLIKHLLATTRKLERVTGLRCVSEVYDASSFSSYFGKSTRILKRKLERASNPAGVGVFCIEDADMVLQSRNDSNVFHGVLELQQHLMNHLSGLAPYYGNTLTVLSTNKPENIDEALLSRMQASYTINPFRLRETHERFLQLHLPHLSSRETRGLAGATHAAGFAGRDLERVVLQARAATTRAPTDEELASRNRSSDRYGVISADLLQALIASAGGKVPRRTQA